MGKIRVAELGDESQEKELKRRADARRQTKQSKKQKVEGVGLHGGERVAVVEGTDIKPEFKRLVDEVEEGKSAEEGKKERKEKTVKVHVRSKKYQEAAKLVDRTKLYPLSKAVTLAIKTSLTKFDGSVEIHLNLNPQTMGGKTDFRTTLTLPHGTGKELNVAVASEAIIAEIESGKINFDVLVAAPSMMPKLAKVARILGPKGLMPNPKNNTVGEDTEKLKENLSKGQVTIKTEPDHPILHIAVGKVSFEEKKLSENIHAVLEAIGKGKITKAVLSATMGPGIKFDPAS